MSHGRGDWAGAASALRPGDRVVLSLPGSPRYVEVVIDLLSRGVFPVPLDPRLTAAERVSILADVQAVLEVADEAGLADLAGELATTGVTADPKAPTDTTARLPLGRPMHVTSGTTGRPKPVDSGVLEPSAARDLLREEQELWGFCADDVNLVVSPLYHSAPLRFAMGTVLAGGRIVVPGPFDPALLTAAIEQHRPTTMFCVPTHLQRLFAHWDEVGTPDLSSFRLVAHAGAPCPTQVKHRLIGSFPAGSTWEFYGSTEGQFTACRSEEWLTRPGTVGRARPGRSLSVDETGHLWCVVPEHARFSYRNAPEKTRAAWRETREGPAFTVGDLGRIDPEGYVYLDGRREDLIISGGVNVYPLEVENALREHPGVQDIAVYALPDPHWGQRVCAAVVGTASEAELRAFARDRLAPPKRPKQYAYLEDLPRTATGKVRRSEFG